MYNIFTFFSHNVFNLVCGETRTDDQRSRGKVFLPFLFKIAFQFVIFCKKCKICRADKWYVLLTFFYISSGKQDKERKYQKQQTESGTEATGMNGMIGDETEMREEIKREAQIDMIGTKQGRLVTNLMIVHTGLLEITRERNGGNETVKEEKDLEKRLRHFYALVMTITGNGSRSQCVAS